MSRKFFLSICLLVFTACVLSVLSACQRHQQEAANVVKVGTIAGPETQLMQIVKRVAAERYGLDVQIVQFTDYTLPNVALQDGSLDANAFQNPPYLAAYNQAHGSDLVSIGNSFLYPLGIYSQKIKNLSELKTGATAAIANDPSNEARGLLVLQAAGLIKLRPGAGITATVQDIVSNPKHLIISTLDAAQIPRALADVDIGVINTNYAIPAGLLPKRDALFVESALNSPYMNIIVARKADQNSQKLKELVQAFQSKPVLEEANKLFKGQAIPGWQTQ